ncbi:AraC family transcriptional regulator [Alkalihalobacillus trypoxylicola]|uniref:HTH araC/xylS-type domain-containing protein n=1 Tax=Alkalihalobacillus trypoxylicola TaxID=519424 RepID=A0A162EJ09_9BACI|nr:AraC family transcriptional regulator [Alkalihalobacillus trypoxylicola]KYG33025.1 hypothetical protein AZF04_17860 [Alkalihalobacillus trypoxylicola]GAF66696.1 putative DNA-binding protein [Bacillus sp. TS-2]
MLNFFNKAQKKQERFKSRYFRNNFILILVVTFIPGLISGVGIYWFGVHEVEKSLVNLHEEQIYQRAENINDQLDYLEISLSNWAFEPRFSAALADIDFVTEFQETRDIIGSLLVLQGSHPLIDHVELFVDSNPPVLFQPSYNVIAGEEYDFYRTFLSSHKNIDWNRLYEIPEETDFADSMPLVLTHTLPGNSSNPIGSIIVTLNRNKTAELIKTLTPYNQGATFLINSENRLLVSDNSTGETGFVGHLRERFQEEVNGSQGSFVFQHEDESYSVSYGTMRRINSEWTYVSAAPMSLITSPLVLISQIIIVISSAGLLVALILTWVASKRIYSPLAKLVKVLDTERNWNEGKLEDEFTLIEKQFKELSNESLSLQNRLTTQLPQLKNSFLTQLIQGYLYHYKEEELRERMQQYGWELKDHCFVIIDIQVSGVKDSEKEALKQGESLVAFALTNIAEEASEQHFKQCNVLNLYDLSAVLLVVHPRQEKLRDELQLFSKEIMDVLNRVLEMQVTITISKTEENVKRIPYLFEDVRKGKRYRNFENQNQIIDLQIMESITEISPIHYPFEIEKEILQAIRMGQINETEKLIEMFIEEVTELGVKDINIKPGITQLYSSIQHEIIHAGIHPDEIFDGKNMFEEVALIGEPKQMIRWLTDEVITPFIETLEGRVNIEMKQIVVQVCSIIQAKYMEDISLESCAEDVHTNPYTLSKAFKKVIGVNFIEYLTTLRLDKAKELLLNTDLKINDIAEQVGYRHSYFNRIFKKHIGVPPSQFRKRRNDSTQVK